MSAFFFIPSKITTATDLQQPAHAATKYSALTTGTWQQTDRIIEYGHWDGAGPGQGNFIAGYDDNGSVTEKLTRDTDGTTEDRSDDSILEEITYEYNLQNRLESITRVGEWINLDSDSEDDGTNKTSYIIGAAVLIY